MDPSDLAVAFLAMVSVGGVAYVLIYPLLSGEARAEKRKAALAQAAPIGRGAEPMRNKRDEVIKSLKEVERKEKARTKLTLAARISQAGLTWSKNKFYLFALVCGFGTAALFFLVTGNPILAPIGYFIGMFGLPFWILGFMKKRRLQKFLNELPNALDVITRGLKAGLPLADCMRIISVEAAEPVRSEFRQIVEAQTLGISIGEASTKLFERVPVPEANFFGIVLAIQQKTGGNLSEALGNLSKVVRERRKMRDKIKAVSMEAKASAAIIASLPFVVTFLVYITSPAYIEKLWITQAGRLVMIGSAIWMFFGVMIMRKMINFDI